MSNNVVFDESFLIRTNNLLVYLGIFLYSLFSNNDLLSIFASFVIITVVVILLFEFVKYISSDVFLSHLIVSVLVSSFPLTLYDANKTMIGVFLTTVVSVGLLVTIYNMFVNKLKINVDEKQVEKDK